MTIPSLLQAGEKALLGLDDALQDTVEAIRCYKLARSRGSAAACERLGSIFLQLYAARGGKVYRRRAMEFFKEGVKRGNAHCYGGLSELFALEGHRDNFQKAWRLFFDGTAKDEDASAPDVCFVAACCRYIGLSLSMSIQPLNLIILRGASAAILSRLLSERDRLAPDDAQRAPLTDALRWTYAVLMPNAPLLSDLRAELQLKKSWRWRRPWQGLALPAA